MQGKRLACPAHAEKHGRCAKAFAGKNLQVMWTPSPRACMCIATGCWCRYTGTIIPPLWSLHTLHDAGVMVQCCSTDCVISACSTCAVPLSVCCVTFLHHTWLCCRLALRCADVLATSYAGRASVDHLIATAPLRLDKQFRNLIITRGDAKADALLRAMESAAATNSSSSTGMSSSLPAGIYARASSLLAIDMAASSSGGSSTSPSLGLGSIQQVIDKLLLSRTATKQSAIGALIKLLSSVGAGAGAESDQLQPVDPALCDALEQGLLDWWHSRIQGKFTPSIMSAKHAWLPCAFAQWRILQIGSSRQAVQQLLGEGAVDAQYLM